MMRKKRILWICNHVTLMDAEVPLLLELGFEVFVPKKFPKGSEFVSCVSKDIYDPSLTIPPEDLALLNTVDFYDDLFSDAVIDAINRNFDIAFCTFYEKPLKLLVRHFPGQIFIRAFGLAGKASYWAVAREDWGRHFLDQMYSIRDRLFFAMSYRNMLKVEKNIFRENAVFLPLGLPETFAQRLKNGYTGKQRQILFVCPKICAVEYYWNAYKKFKRDFWGFPYVIAGNPFGKIADRHLLGYLPRAEFDRVFCESRVMYYHSVEPRHLHYHPLEAIYANQPLIFMSQGMLGQLTPKVKYPGAADTILEAKIKVGRVLMNSRRFIRDIQESQKELLQFFTPEYVKGFWLKNFMPLAGDAVADRPRNETITLSLPSGGKADAPEEPAGKPAPSPIVAEKQEHVGLILPIGYRGGTLHAFLQIAKMLKACGYRVTIGLPDDYLDREGMYYYPTIMDEVLRTLDKDSDIPIRFYKWKKIPLEENEMLRELSRLPALREKNLLNGIMDDHVNCFCECDRWLFVSDRFFSGIPIPLRPYSVVVYDFLQRYMPFQLLPPKFETLYTHSTRQAESLFVTNPETANDMVVYNGVSSKKIFLLPFEFTADEMKRYTALNRAPFRNKRPYIVWACNRGWHKNHVRVLHALIRYYSEFCGQLEVYITGVETSDLDYKKNSKKNKEKDAGKKKKPEAALPQHIIEFRDLFKKNKEILKKNVHIKGEMDRYSYFDLLSGAEFLLLSSLSDNGAFGAVEAAWLGTPCASSDYPHMRYMAKHYGITPLWYKGEWIDSITDALNMMPRCSEEYRAKLPSRESLEALSYEHHQEYIRKTLREAWT